MSVLLGTVSLCLGVRAKLRTVFSLKICLSIFLPPLNDLSKRILIPDNVQVFKNLSHYSNNSPDKDCVGYFSSVDSRLLLYFFGGCPSTSSLSPYMATACLMCLLACSSHLHVVASIQDFV